MRNVIVSGMHSEMNPSPGVGVTRSLHAAWPDLLVFGLDYSARSTGLNLPELAGRFIMPPLGSVDIEEAANDLVRLADEHDALFISGLDLESRVLASVCPERMIVPPGEAFDWIRKDNLGPLANELDLKAPRTRVVDDVPGASLTAEASGWRMWLKGPNYEAHRTYTAFGLEDALAALESTWGGPALLQEDIQGHEASYCIAADNGSLLAACRMNKRQTTPMGKTWAGEVRPCDSRETTMLKRFVSLTNWTGGAELELVVQSKTEHEYLIDVNPRFPAWVYGATLAGINLPAALVSRRLNRRIPLPATTATSFTRIVVEVPQLVEGARPLGNVASQQHAGKGHPSGMPALSRSLATAPAENATKSVRIDLDVPEKPETPIRHFLSKELRARLSLIKETLERVERAIPVSTGFAFSMKTNPRADLLELVREAGAGIECISRSEVSRAEQAGFASDRVVLNGPGKWWPPSPDPLRVGFTFADSLEDFKRIRNSLACGRLQCKGVGIRIRPPGVGSRFGLDLAEREDFLQVARIAAQLPSEVQFGMHFHKALSSVGPEVWLDNFRGALELFAALCSVESIRPAVIDIGGGWPVHLSAEDLYAVWGSAAASADAILGRGLLLLAEPGKFLAEPSMVLLSRVLEVRRRRGSVNAIVVDAAINLLPDVCAPTRRVLWRSPHAKTWAELRKGDGEILGRICMESDTLRRMVYLPPDLKEGDWIAFLGVGAYDESMAYEFGV